MRNVYPRITEICAGFVIFRVHAEHLTEILRIE